MEAHHPHRLIRMYENASEVPNTWTSKEQDLMELNMRGRGYFREQNDYVQNFQLFYQEAVDYLDRRVSHFVRSVQQNTENEVTFIITSDHGENLGSKTDDFLLGHTASLSEGLLHIPLDIINPPSKINVCQNQIFSQRQLRNFIGMCLLPERFRHSLVNCS
jgi:arylsulfatase A-like enzyme